MPARSLPLMVLLCGLLSIGCASSETDETGTGGTGGAGATGGTGGTGGAAAAGGTAGSGGSGGGICGAEERCTRNEDCVDFCIDLCGGLENTDTAFCAVDDACACVCFEGDCDRTGCALIECTPSPTANDFCDDQGVELCRGAPRDAVCLPNGAAEIGFCDIVCDSGTETCKPDP